MKLCYFANLQNIHTQRWIDYFSSEGDEVHVITNQPCIYNKHDIHIHSIKKNSSIPIMSKLIKIFYIINLVKTISPDIIHVHSADYGKFLLFLRNYPTILSVWGSDVLMPAKKSLLKKILLKLVLKRADVITTTAVFMGPYIHEHFNVSLDKIVRIPWGVDLSIFNRNYHDESKKLRRDLGISEDSFVLISNRHINPLYQTEKIIEASRLILDSRPNTYFVLVKGYGTPFYENEMKELAKKLGVNKNMIFVSKILAPKEMAVYLNMADAFISIPKTDQFGTSVVEGMACGLVPIVSDINVYEQYLNKDNSIIVNPEDVEDIATKINYLIHNTVFKNKASSLNKKIVEKYEDWNKNSKKMKDLYAYLLSKEDYNGKI